jgi:hypothetical protein
VSATRPSLACDRRKTLICLLDEVSERQRVQWQARQPGDVIVRDCRCIQAAVLYSCEGTASCPSNCARAAESYDVRLNNQRSLNLCHYCFNAIFSCFAMLGGTVTGREIVQCCVGRYALRSSLDCVLEGLTSSSTKRQIHHYCRRSSCTLTGASELCGGYQQGTSSSFPKPMRADTSC